MPSRLKSSCRQTLHVNVPFVFNNKRIFQQCYYSSVWLIGRIYFLCCGTRTCNTNPYSLHSPSPDCSRFRFGRAKVVSLLDTEYSCSACLSYKAEKKDSTPTNTLLRQKWRYFTAKNLSQFQRQTSFN
jgi:hypothetical protein